ncbi:unnamed protein product [Vitrella brassicaformis CCMP3155]|uniref:Uncharacterized protein n=1 Tax=Vitrella brassicaformis (strain CCMP3155) TaxID=1169540 RepID=A0A0G4GS97_VITBC|nr:unnamed protein product [Vitrella brassicaformis CCMP3155]|eukprot:CEM33474.1 unnamed protein product [Vitrella brassicaformis CCMP3155]
MQLPSHLGGLQSAGGEPLPPFIHYSYFNHYNRYILVYARIVKDPERLLGAWFYLRNRFLGAARDAPPNLHQLPTVNQMLDSALRRATSGAGGQNLRQLFSRQQMIDIALPVCTHDACAKMHTLLTTDVPVYHSPATEQRANRIEQLDMVRDAEGGVTWFRTTTSGGIEPVPSGPLRTTKTHADDGVRVGSSAAIDRQQRRIV